MFNNICKKIRICSIVLLCVGLGLSLFLSIPYFDDYYNYLGFFTFIGGSVLSYVNSILIYGFGIIVENSEKNLNDSSQKNDNV